MMQVNVTLTRFIWGHAVLFLHLFYLGSEERHKVTTPNCGSLGEEKIVLL